MYTKIFFRKIVNGDPRNDPAWDADVDALNGKKYPILFYTHSSLPQFQ